MRSRREEYSGIGCRLVGYWTAGWSWRLDGSAWILPQVGWDAGDALLPRQMAGLTAERERSRDRRPRQGEG